MQPVQNIIAVFTFPSLDICVLGTCDHVNMTAIAASSAVYGRLVAHLSIGKNI
jgi:hypothetical protein